MRRLLADYRIGENLSESELEDEFFRLCDDHDIPRPQAQVEIGPDRIDFLFAEQRLAIETDSWRWHGGRQAWENDGKRNIRLQRLGLRVLRVSYRRVFREPAAVAEDLKAFL
jgi:very-short-patch-repair endonuclease